MRIGYNTNGFAHHSLHDALEILAELGYRAVALTPDVHHLPPFGSSAGELRDLRRRLERLELAVVVETGARFVLDPRRKHSPSLLNPEPEGRSRRLAFLVRCAEIAAELGGDTVSVWAGARPADTSPELARTFLEEGIDALCRRAEPLGVGVAFEPEPGMWVESLEEWDRLRDGVGHANLGLTLDVGHVPCSETISPADAIRARAAELFNVHLDDSRGGVHEHLQIGEGELDWGEILAALRASGFAGVASVELSRHSHCAPEAAAAAARTLRALDPHGWAR